MHWTTTALPAIALGTFLQAADCIPQPPAPCYSVDSPCCDTCLGPENVAGNPAVRPKTCNGDFVLELSAFYWNAHQDGLTYGVDTTSSNANNLINSHYLKPNFHWEPGFKLGVGYNTTHDGWDLDLLWTRYRGRASSQSDAPDNGLLLPLWSAFASTPLTASTIESHWKLALDMIDLELGREFWNSKYLAMRPFIGLRYARLDQDYTLKFRGGSWGSTQNGQADMDNDFWGIGIRGGLDTTWHLCRGFSLFGNLGLSLLYGRFDIHQREFTQGTSSPFFTSPVLQTQQGFHSSKAVFDLALGLQYATFFCDHYGFTVGFGWENHLFFSQNQLWQVVRNNGENIFNQVQGDLSIQGWTLNFRFEF